MLLPIVRIIEKQFPHALFRVNTRDKLIALTIDDVGDESTQIILDFLATAEVKATFFVITSYLTPDMVTKIRDSGHEVGNHGVYDRAHADLFPAEFATEIEQAHQALQGNISWFRPGRGRYNQNMVACLKGLSRDYGYNSQFALASFVPFDTFVSNPQLTSLYLIQQIFPGAIWVLHGGSTTRAINTRIALETTLPYLKQRGYQLTTLSDLTKLVIN